MDTSDNLGLPYLMPSQAQKHVTHNEALAMLDALVQLSVADRDLSAPPPSPAAGARYIVAAGATEAWAGHSGAVAQYLDDAWTFHPPRPGFLCHVADEGAFLYWTGAAWADVSVVISALQNITRLGLGTTADATNPFAAKLNKALWTARTASEGGDGDLRYTMNKETASDVLSILLQTGFSGRAELGLIGNDNLALKVSPDGSAWTTAVTVDRTTGVVSLNLGSSVPVWRVIASDAAGWTHTGSTTETTMVTLSGIVPANGPNGVLRITTLWSCSVNDASVKSGRVRINGTEVDRTSLASNRSHSKQVNMRNRGASNAQVAQGPTSQSTYNVSTIAPSTYSFDMTGALTITFTVQNAASGDSTRLEYYLIEALYGA